MKYLALFINHITGEHKTFERELTRAEFESQLSYWSSTRSAQDLIDAWNRQVVSADGIEWGYSLITA